MTTPGGISHERLAEIKKICACVPFVDAVADAGVEETQAAMRELIEAVETQQRTSDEPTAGRVGWLTREDISAKFEDEAVKCACPNCRAWRQALAALDLAAENERLKDECERWKREAEAARALLRQDGSPMLPVCIDSEYNAARAANTPPATETRHE